jgi:hypothetical protein
MERTPRFVSILFAVSLLLALVGNLFGSILTEGVPQEWKRWLVLLLVLVVVAYVGASIFLLRLQGAATGPESRLRRSQTHQRALIVWTIVVEGLAALGGIMSNVTAEMFPGNLKPYVLPAFLVVTLLAIGIAILLARIQHSPAVDVTNRRDFVFQLHDRYRQHWDDAVRGAAPIELRWHEDPQLLTRRSQGNGSFAAAHSILSDPSAMLADGQTAQPDLTQVYDAAKGHVLVLGAPGAGKTMAILALAIVLLERARDEDASAVPVIFNLSTWAINRHSLTMWMIEDLVESYHVLRAVAEQWVAAHQVQPILDGLDEVARSEREACIEAINTFRRDHPDAPLVVCCRVEEYGSDSLQLATAVLAQPLANEQIMDYLAACGEKLARFRNAVQRDTMLRDLLRTPLILRLVSSTYAQLPRKELPEAGDPEVWRARIFPDYVAAMLEWERPKFPQRYTVEETCRYLAWLAWQMQAHQEVELHLWDIKMDWLPNDGRMRQRFGVLTGLYSYRGFYGGLRQCLLAGLYCGLVGMVIGYSLSNSGIGGVSIGLLVGLGFWLGSGLVMGIGTWLGSVFDDTSAWFIGWLTLIGLGAGGILGGLIDDVGSPLGWEVAGTGSGAISGICMGAVLVAVSRAQKRKRATATEAATPTEAGIPVNTARQGERQSRKSNWGMGIAILLVVGLIVGTCAVNNPLLYTLDFGVLFGALVCGGCALLVVSILPRGSGQDQGHGEAQALRAEGFGGIGLLTALFVGLILPGPLGALGAQLQTGHPHLVEGATVLVLLGIVMVLMAVGLIYTGNEAVRRVALQRTLWWARLFPFNVTDFLDYAASRHLLYKVGGDYRFIHILLRDYFADLNFNAG